MNIDGLNQAEVESERDHAQADIARQQVETQELLRKSKELEEQLAHKPPPEVIVKEVEVVKEVIREVEVVKEITPEPPPDTPAAHPPPESPPKSANSTPKDVTLVTELPDPVSDMGHVNIQVCVLNRKKTSLP